MVANYPRRAPRSWTFGHRNSALPPGRRVCTGCPELPTETAGAPRARALPVSPWGAGGRRRAHPAGRVAPATGSARAPMRPRRRRRPVAPTPQCGRGHRRPIAHTPQCGRGAPRTVPNGPLTRGTPCEHARQPAPVTGSGQGCVARIGKRNASSTPQPVDASRVRVRSGAWLVGVDRPRTRARLGGPGRRAPRERARPDTRAGIGVAARGPCRVRDAAACTGRGRWRGHGRPRGTALWRVRAREFDERRVMGLYDQQLDARRAAPWPERSAAPTDPHAPGVPAFGPSRRRSHTRAGVCGARDRGVCGARNRVRGARNGGVRRS
jgi:hypothetical protein